MANSSTEAEYVFLSDCGRQAKWLWQLLGELGYNLHSIPVCGDNQSFIFMASNPVTEARSKHIDIKWHSIWELVSDKIIELFFVEGAQNPAVTRASRTVEEREQRVLQSRMGHSENDMTKGGVNESGGNTSYESMKTVKVKKR